MRHFCWRRAPYRHHRRKRSHPHRIHNWEVPLLCQSCRRMERTFYFNTTESDSNPSPTPSMEVDQSSQTSFYEFPSRVVASPAYGTEIDITLYTLNVQADQWFLSETDLKWIADGCYILGCGGGGSPPHAFLELGEMVRNGSIIRVVDLSSVPQDAMIGWGGGMGSPEVTSERLLGNECVHSSSICVGLCPQWSHNLGITKPVRNCGHLLGYVCWPRSISCAHRCTRLLNLTCFARWKSVARTG